MTDLILPICVSLLMRECRVHPDVMIYLFACQLTSHFVANIQVPPVILRQLEIKPVLVSDTRHDLKQFITNEVDIALRSHKSRASWPKFCPSKEVFGLFREDEHEDFFEYLFPPRTKADRGIRNVRFTDIWAAYVADGREECFWRCLTALKGKSYIFSLNICTYAFFLYDEWFAFLEPLGIFELTEYDLRDVLKCMSDNCKKTVFLQDRRTVSVFIENHNLFGALQPPVEGWDPVRQTEALASNTLPEHGLIGTEKYYGDDFFQRTADGCLRTPALRRSDDDKRYGHFRDYVETGPWERSGAASFGRVTWRLEDLEDSTYDKSGSFKARKNFILDTVPVEELNRACLCKEDHTHNVALVKSELAKIRIAVSSPLELYLLESWVLDWAHGYYLNWPGSTLEESTDEEFNRNYRQWLLMRQGKFVLPYDFESFDHQIRKPEMHTIVAVGHDIAKSMYSGDARLELDQACNIVRNSIERATLSDPPAYGKSTYSVHDCLLSGMRTTSIVGNGFNLVCFKMAETVLDDILCLDRNLYDVEVRGDDLRLTSGDQFLLILYYYIYKAMGLKANPSKFSLSCGRGDFLRLDCDRECGMVGLPARTLPSIVQRKPWKATPWLGETRLQTVCENTYNVLRRLPDPNCPVQVGRTRTLVETLLSNWKRVTGVKANYAIVPRIAGGLGLGLWDRRSFVSSRGTKVPVNIFEQIPLHLSFPDNRQDTRHRAYFERYRKYGLEVSFSEAESLVRQDLLQKVATDDVPDLIDAVRWHYRRFVKGIKTRLYKAKKSFLNTVNILYETFRSRVENLEPAHGFLNTLVIEGTLDLPIKMKKYANRTEEIRDRLRLGRLRGIRASDVLRDSVPGFFDDCRILER